MAVGSRTRRDDKGVVETKANDRTTERQTDRKKICIYNPTRSEPQKKKSRRYKKLDHSTDVYIYIYQIHLLNVRSYCPPTDAKTYPYQTGAEIRHLGMNIPAVHTDRVIGKHDTIARLK